MPEDINVDNMNSGGMAAYYGTQNQARNTGLSLANLAFGQRSTMFSPILAYYAGKNLAKGEQIDAQMQQAMKGQLERNEKTKNGAISIQAMRFTNEEAKKYSGDPNQFGQFFTNLYKSNFENLGGDPKMLNSVQTMTPLDNGGVAVRMFKQKEDGTPDMSSAKEFHLFNAGVYELGKNGKYVPANTKGYATIKDINDVLEAEAKITASHGKSNYAPANYEGKVSGQILNVNDPAQREIYNAEAAQSKQGVGGIMGYVGNIKNAVLGRPSNPVPQTQDPNIRVIGGKQYRRTANGWSPL